MIQKHASILVGLLWCLALLSMIVVGVLHTARMDLITGKNFGDKIQARYLALAGIEKAEALLYRNARERSHSGKNHTGELYNDPQDFQGVTFGRGSYSVLRRGNDEEGGGVIYGVSDEERRLNINTANRDEIMKVPGLENDVAEAILSWRGQGTNVAETDYYASLRPPYLPRGGPFETIRELLMVRGVTPDLFFGRDVHLNGMLDDQSDGANGQPQFQETVAAQDLGWAGIMTVDSSVKNVSASGDARVNIQTADENSLASVRGITRDIAHAIVSYRQKNNFQGIVDLLDVTPPQDNPNAGLAPDNANSQPDSASGGNVISGNLLMKIADDVTVTDDRQLAGLVNINTASLDVLACLPGIDRNMAQKIISHRDSSGYYANPAELLEIAGMSRRLLKQVAPLVTARSETFRILAEGRVKSTGASQRIQVIVKINLDGVKMLSYREDDL